MAKDSKLNAVYTCLGASNHSMGDREVNDYYATPPEAVRELLRREKFNKDILEPCCGEGHISGVLEEFGYNVTSTDLIDRGYGKGGINFITDWKEFNGDIITNTPYKYAKEFTEHALDIIPEGNRVAMLLKIQFLEGKARREMFEKTPPKFVYVFSSRVKCAKNGEFDKYPSSAVCYAWFIWEKGYKGEPVIRWI